MWSILLRSVLWTTVSIAAKLVLRHFSRGGPEFLEVMTPLLNLIVFSSGGAILGSIFAGPTDPKRWSGRTELRVLAMFVMLHAAVYFATYIGDYYEWTGEIARSAHVGWDSACEQRDEMLRASGVPAGFRGYATLVMRSSGGPLKPDDVPDDLIEMIVWAIPKIVQWLAQSLGLHIDGLIDLLYWYVIAVVTTVLACRFLSGK